MKYKSVAVLVVWLVATAVLPTVSAGGTYGPTGSDETLWSIAHSHLPDNSVSVQQMMQAIREKNPQAFGNSGNINSLKVGTYLQIPDLQEIRQYSHTQALQETRVDNRNWKKSANTANSRQLQARLQREISTLRQRLQQEQQRSRTLNKQIVEERQYSENLRAKLKRLQDSNHSTQANPAKTEEIAKLEGDINQMKQLLDERDTHIQSLQASLREASIAIKRQYTESLELHKQLKALDPNFTGEIPATPPEPGQGAAPSLTLGPVENSNTPPATADADNKGNPPTHAKLDPATGKPIAFADQLQSQPTEPPPATPPISLKNMLEQQQSAAATSSIPPATNANTGKPSRISLAIALMALLFVLAVLWRSYARQRAMRREENQLRASLAPQPSKIGQTSTL